MNKHCWHDKGTTLTTYPPQTPVVCCKCGASATRRMTRKLVPGHGRFAPGGAYEFTDEPLPEGPCTGDTTIPPDVTY